MQAASDAPPSRRLCSCCGQTGAHLHVHGRRLKRWRHPALGASRCVIECEPAAERAARFVGSAADVSAPTCSRASCRRQPVSRARRWMAADDSVAGVAKPRGLLRRGSPRRRLVGAAPGPQRVLRSDLRRCRTGPQRAGPKDVHRVKKPLLGSLVRRNQHRDHDGGRARRRDAAKGRRRQLRRAAKARAALPGLRQGTAAGVVAAHDRGHRALRNAAALRFAGSPALAEPRGPGMPCRDSGSMVHRARPTRTPSVGQKAMLEVPARRPPPAQPRDRSSRPT